MAHMARVAGTDYAVAGGKTLIDGTAYSVVATREVEKTVAVSGQFTGNTIENEAFDWNKYQINSIAIKGPNTNGYLTALFRTPGLSDYIETFEAGRPNTIGWPPVFDTVFIISSRISPHNASSSFMFNFFISFGEFTLSRYDINSTLFVQLFFPVNKVLAKCLHKLVIIKVI